MKIGSLNPNAFGMDKGDTSLGLKSPTLWGIEDTKMYPLIFFRKPKWVSQAEFDELMDRIEITIKTKGNRNENK